MFGEELYRLSYDSSIRVLKNVVPYITEDVDTKSRLAKSVKDVPRIIAAEFALGGKAVDDDSVVLAAKMCREIQVMLSFCRDLNGQFINGKLCSELIGAYGLVESRLLENGEGGEANMEGLGC